MNLKFHYIKLALVILALLVCFCFNAYTQSSTTIGNDTVVVTIKDENNNSVSLYLPESLNNDQCERRIYGTRTGVIGMFKTLYSEERRTESYEAAIRELCMQPGASQSYIGHLEKSLQSAGVASEDANFVLDLVKYGANSINKKYITGGTLTADVHNRLAKVGRELNAAQKSPAFAQACIAFENVKATAKLTETITGAFLLNSLSTDQAWIRLKEIERAVDSERQAQGKVDPALEAAIEQSEINLLAAQSKIGAFAVSVNDNLQEITDSAIGLGATLADMSFKFSAPVAMWVAAPLMTYNTLRGVSDQWEMAQDGVSLATVTKMVERHSQGREGVTDNITSYGQYAFYSQMEETFSVGGAKFHDFLSPGSANKDWSQYYKQRKQNTVVIAMKSSNFQEDEAEVSAKPEMVTWEKTFGGSDYDWANSVVQTNDGGYVIAGFTKSYGSGDSDGWVIKLNKQGNRVWDKTFGGKDNEILNSIIQTTDDGYAVTGSTESYGSSEKDAWVIKLDTQGNKIWDNVFEVDIYGKSIIQSIDDGYVIAGVNLSFLAWNAWVIKLDSQGNKIWEKDYNRNRNHNSEAISVIQTTDGNYVIAAYHDVYGLNGDNFWVFKLNSKGGKIWDKSFGGSSNEIAHSIIQTTDGGYAVAGYTSSYGAGKRDFWIVKLNSKGGKIWDKSFGGISNENAYSIIQTTDGGYAVAGYTSSYGAGKKDIWVIKLDSQGNKIWERTLGGNKDDCAFTIIQTSDGGYALTGYTESYGAGSTDIWVIKLDEKGNLK